MSRGFTLIELIIVIALAVIIFSFTVGVGSDFYLSQSLIAERDSVVSLLRRARIKAMNNTRQSNQGLFIAAGEYVIFEGDTYAGRSVDFDEVFPRAGRVQISGPSEIVFNSSEGSSSASGTISIVSGAGTAKILVNSEGRISW